MRYDGIKFQMSQKFTVLFSIMHKRKDPWIEKGSVLVGCIFIVSGVEELPTRTLLVEVSFSFYRSIGLAYSILIGG